MTALMKPSKEFWEVSFAMLLSLARRAVSLYLDSTQRCSPLHPWWSGQSVGRVVPNMFQCPEGALEGLGPGHYLLLNIVTEARCEDNLGHMHNLGICLSLL